MFFLPDQHQDSKMNLTLKTAEEVEEMLRSNGLKKVADVFKGMIFFNILCFIVNIQ